MLLSVYEEAYNVYIQLFIDTEEMKSKVDLISSKFFDQIQLAIDSRRTLKLDCLRGERKFAGEKIQMMVAIFDSLFPPTEISFCPFPVLKTFFIEELRYLFDLPSCKI